METKTIPRSAETPSDEELRNRVLAGDLAAFELLMRRHNQRVFRVCRSVLKSDEEAEEAAQQAWVDAYTHLASFEGRSSLSTWLCRIGLHVSLARLRKLGREVHLVDEETIVDHTNPEDLAARSEMRRLVERAVSELPSGLASAFVLREVEGLSTAEAAACLEISEDALKTRLLRAKRMLREDVERELGRAATDVFRFDGARCDRMVRNVMERIG
jgi:RNA polymerase sigma-70 factor (ECF subfamily)